MKTRTVYLVYNFKKILNLALFCLPASQLAIRPGNTSAMASDFYPKKVIASILQICYSEEDSSTAPWSFFYPSILSFL